ncbi:MAG: hypothetical protein IJ927_05465 [Eubacterium sp.]|nr:hypothetical protein [Eubacterium sp.]
MKKVISILLAIVLVVAMFAGCGKNSEQSKAEVLYPVPTDAEAAVDSAAGLALNYYMTGRAYLDMFINYDTSTLDEGNIDEYKALVDNAVKAFENADKVNDVLGEALDIYEKEEPGEGPKAKTALVQPPTFGMVAKAAEMGSKEWAQSIMDEYAKAKPGQAIRHLASQLGTDAKHAYAQMKMAQDILMGAEYTQIADKANTAVKTATVLKTAGTAAGLVIAVATAPASGAIATAVSTGGITISGVNTVLEIGSTASILYTNGEDNEFSMACDKTESQLAPIGQIFAIAGVGTNIKDLASAGKDIFKNGYKSLSPQAQQDLGMNTFGVISYGAGAINDYVNGGSIMSGTFTKGDDGVNFTLWNTLTGTEPEKQEAVRTVLKEGGVSEEDINKAISSSNQTTAAKTESTSSAGEQKTNQEPQNEGAMTVNDIQSEIANSIIDNNKPIMQDDFDLDSYLKLLQNILYEIALEEYGEEYANEIQNSLDYANIIGTYKVKAHFSLHGEGLSYSEDEDGVTEMDSTFTIVLEEGTDYNVNMTFILDDEVHTIGTYDEDNATLNFKVEEEYSTTTGTMKFKAENGVITADFKSHGEGTDPFDGELETEDITGTCTKEG